MTILPHVPKDLQTRTLDDGATLEFYYTRGMNNAAVDKFLKKNKGWYKMILPSYGQMILGRIIRPVIEVEK